MTPDERRLLLELARDRARGLQAEATGKAWAGRKIHYHDLLDQRDALWKMIERVEQDKGPTMIPASDAQMWGWLMLTLTAMLVMLAEVAEHVGLRSNGQSLVAATESGKKFADELAARLPKSPSGGEGSKP